MIEKLRNLGATLHDSQHSLTGTGIVWMPSHLGCFLEVSSTTRTLLRTFKKKLQVVKTSYLAQQTEISFSCLGSNDGKEICTLRQLSCPLRLPVSREEMC